MGLLVVVTVAGTSLILAGGCRRPDGGSGRETGVNGTSGPAVGMAPPIPKERPLARPRSLEQVGLPAELTRSAIALFLLLGGLALRFVIVRLPHGLS